MTFSGFTVKIKLRCACLLRLRAALSKSSHHKAHGGMTASAASHVDPQNHPKKEGWSLKKQYTSMRQTCSLWCTLRGAMPTCPAGQVSSKLPQAAVHLGQKAGEIAAELPDPLFYRTLFCPKWTAASVLPQQPASAHPDPAPVNRAVNNAHKITPKRKDGV